MAFQHWIIWLSGRISRTTGLLSNIFNMKVVMDFENTELIPVGESRGVKTFNKWFDELKSELSKIPNVRQIGISHADGLELSKWIQRRITSNL